MRAIWAILLGLLLGIGAAWWLSRESPERRKPRRPHVGTSAAQVADHRPALYRWRDDQGVLQITDQPPKGRRYERIERDARTGIEVSGDRQE